MAALPLQFNPIAMGGVTEGEGYAAHLHLNSISSNISSSYQDMAMIMGNGVAKKDDRIPQWTHQETKDFIAIRSELKTDFNQTKRNKSLWETIAAKMKERGHRRSADQCKCKWKNLHNRYKAMAITQGTDWRPCPFYEELNAIFSEPDNTPMGLSTDCGKRKSRKGQSSEDISDADDDEDEESEEDAPMRRPHKKPARSNAEKGRSNSMQEILEDFFQQQERIEKEWMDVLQKREDERRKREEAWMAAMQQLEHERLSRELAWREREEQRRSREEARAQTRDALFSVLLSRLVKDG